MNKNILILSLTALLLLSPLTARASISEGIAATVNDSVVTVSDVQQRVALYLSGAGHAPTAAERQMVEKQALAKLIDEAIQLQEAKKLNISVSDDLVKKGFEAIARQNGMAPDEFSKQLKAAGVSIDSLYAQIRAEISWEQVVRQKLGPQVTVSERDIDMTMDKLAEQKGKHQYHVAEILLNVKNASDENNVRLKADALVKQIRGGERFSVVARDNSEAPGASAGGDMGWLQEGQMDAALEAALQKMHPGQISEPVRAGSGYHILFLREARDAGGALVEAQAASGGPVVLIKQILIPVNPKTDTNTVIEAKRQRGLALRKEIKSCDALDKRAKDFPGKGTGTLGQAYEEKLPEPLKSIVKKLKVGALSEPVQSPGGWAMLMVCSREEEKAPAAAADAAPTPDKTDEKARESIAGKLGSQRLGQMADHYLSDLRAAAFIDKRI